MGFGLRVLDAYTVVASIADESAADDAAGDLRAAHYHRERSAVSLADCIALASAEAVHEPLATPDPALAAMARAEGVDVVALPDSRGQRPTAEPQGES